tara:strand:+ start:232 stop:408 length:177 start_codon:yes stop_codon:yes gene_type:complete
MPTVIDRLVEAQTSTEVQAVLNTIVSTDSGADSVTFGAQSTSASVTSGFGGVSDTVSF